MFVHGSINSDEATCVRSGPELQNLSGQAIVLQWSGGGLWKICARSSMHLAGYGFGQSGVVV